MRIIGPLAGTYLAASDLNPRFCDYYFESPPMPANWVLFQSSVAPSSAVNGQSTYTEEDSLPT